MIVRRIVANIATSDPQTLAVFYRDLLGLDLLMDHGFIATVGNGLDARVQLSLAAEGGSGTDVPDLSVEVDDLEGALAAAERLGVAVVYGPVKEPWGVRRFFLRDPAGTLVNILSHA